VGRPENNCKRDGVADGVGLPKVYGVIVVLQWLNSPVAWTVIVLILSWLGIFRELL
jgi:hypothetical protein